MDKKTTTKKKYFYAVGRRKTSVAIIKLFPRGEGKFNIRVNDTTVPIKKYFDGHKYLLEDALYPFYILGDDSIKKYDLEITVRGGGLRGQAEAIRLGIARGLVEYNDKFRSQLKPYSLLKRNPKSKERKKPGLRKARRSPQWSKR